ncbi:DUF1272 domain-containing protein [Tepidicaulis sp.]|uniref:DUF1272 domain-containing protein n=1 Tax=Tepidicaulis sp. TaxID=1920809 RepID=UPI003B5B9255
MRTECEKCKTSTPPEGEASICSYECTFCVPCTSGMNHRCPNCGGELVARPKRVG